MTKGIPGFEINEGFSPQPGGKIFDKTVNSSFQGTGLLEYLVENENSTFDNEHMAGKQSYKYYNELMWRGRYAECISVEETIERMKG